MQGKTVTKILTVFLCAFSFALFALASTGFAYNKTDFLVRAYTYMVQNTYPYITFENEQGDEKGNYTSRVMRRAITLWNRNASTAFTQNSEMISPMSMTFVLLLL